MIICCIISSSRAWNLNFLCVCLSSMISKGCKHFKATHVWVTCPPTYLRVMVWKFCFWLFSLVLGKCGGINFLWGCWVTCPPSYLSARLGNFWWNISPVFVYWVMCPPATCGVVSGNFSSNCSAWSVTRGLGNFCDTCGICSARPVILLYGGAGSSVLYPLLVHCMLY